jgi:hypothetical protein
VSFPHDLGCSDPHERSGPHGRPCRTLLDAVPRSEIPFVPIDRVDVTVESIMCDHLVVRAGALDSPLGHVPVVILSFASSAQPGANVLPDIAYVSSPAGLRALAQLVAQAVDRAIEVTA